MWQGYGLRCARGGLKGGGALGPWPAAVPLVDES